MKSERELYLQEIDELTELMRTDPDWGDLKACLVNRGVDPETTLLVSFSETEDEREFGVFVTSDANVYEYERRTDSLSPHAFEKCFEISDASATFHATPTVSLALELMRHG